MTNLIIKGTIVSTEYMHTGKIAVNRFVIKTEPFKDDGSEMDFELTAFGDLAEALNEYEFKKVICGCYVRSRDYETKAGQKRLSTELRASWVAQMIEQKTDNTQKDSKSLYDNVPF